MMAVKRSKKDGSKSRLEEDEIREGLVSGVEAMATQGDEGAPSKKTWVVRKKKVFIGKKTASQFCEELNLEPIHTEVNQEQGVVNQGVTKSKQPNEPFGPSDEVSSEGSRSVSDRKGPRRRETPMAKLKNDVCEMRLAMSSLMDQNQMLVEIIKSMRSSSSDAIRPMFFKNVLKPTT